VTAVSEPAIPARQGLGPVVQFGLLAGPPRLATVLTAACHNGSGLPSRPGREAAAWLGRCLAEQAGSSLSG
jgi:hypothetical protein